MSIEDLAKALYFLNGSLEYNTSFAIEKIEKELIWFNNGKTMPLQILVNAYDLLIKTGEVVRLF